MRKYNPFFFFIQYISENTLKNFPYSAACGNLTSRIYCGIRSILLLKYLFAVYSFGFDLFASVQGPGADHFFEIKFSEKRSEIIGEIKLSTIIAISLNDAVTKQMWCREIKYSREFKFFRFWIHNIPETDVQLHMYLCFL